MLVLDLVLGVAGALIFRTQEHDAGLAARDRRRTAALVSVFLAIGRLLS
jgi:hypothetical protein